MKNNVIQMYKCDLCCKRAKGEKYVLHGWHDYKVCKECFDKATEDNTFFEEDFQFNFRDRL